jgi:hypothetical protein
MTSLPVDPSASRALEEDAHRRMHMLGDPVPRFLSVERGQRCIAEGTAGQRTDVRRRERLKDLSQLVINMIALDQDVVPGKGTGSKAGVTGQDDATLLQGKAQDVIIRERRAVEDIEPEQPHPLREPAQHGICDEFHKQSRQYTVDGRRGITLS